jgi:6-pyruvoyltetrahydropterin/6-carboxytetrahydropterin synthase
VRGACGFCPPYSSLAKAFDFSARIPPLAHVRLTRAVEFSTSLRYWNPGLSEAENLARFGRKTSQHGHNYRLEVTVAGEPDPVTGMVIDLKDLQEVIDREVMVRFDHRDLNCDTPYFDKEPPTPENLTRVIDRVLRAALPPGLLYGIRLFEDADTFVELIGPGDAA